MIGKHNLYVQYCVDRDNRQYNNLYHVHPKYDVKLEDYFANP